MRWVGGATLWGGAAPSWTRSTPGDRARTMSAGFRACHDFPGGFTAVLDRMLETRSSGSRSPIGVYGKLQGWLGVASDPAFEPLRAAIRHHIGRHIPMTGSTRVLRQPATGGELTTIGALATLCGCSEGRVATIAAMLSLIEPVATPTRSLVVPRSIEAPLAAFFRSSCETGEARKYLNVNAELFKMLVYEGQVKRAFPLNGLTIPARYHIADLDRFLTRLHRNVPLMDHAPPGCAPILKAVRVCSRSSREIVLGLLCGNLRAVGHLRHEQGVRQVLVNTAEVTAALPRKSTEP